MIMAVQWFFPSVLFCFRRVFLEKGINFLLYLMARRSRNCLLAFSKEEHLEKIFFVTRL